MVRSIVRPWASGISVLSGIRTTNKIGAVRRISQRKKLKEKSGGPATISGGFRRSPGRPIKPPENLIDLLDAAALVARTEGIIGYKFKNRMICLQALAPERCSWYENGRVETVASQQRLALLGDRTLSLILCDMWSESVSKPAVYNKIPTLLESRQALYRRGKRLGLHESVLIPKLKTTSNEPEIPLSMISETVEAIIGAVYEDSNKDIDTVRQIIANLGFEHDVRSIIKEASMGQDSVERQRHPGFNPILDEAANGSDQTAATTTLVNEIETLKLRMLDAISGHVVSWRTSVASVTDYGQFDWTKVQGVASFPEYPISDDIQRRRKQVKWKMVHCEMRIAKYPLAPTTSAYQELFQRLSVDSIRMGISQHYYSSYKARVSQDYAEIMELYQDLDEKIHLLATRADAVDEDSRKRIADRIQLLKNWMQYLEIRHTAKRPGMLLRDGISMLRMVTDAEDIREIKTPKQKAQHYRDLLQLKLSMENELISVSQERRVQVEHLLTQFDFRLRIARSLYPNLPHELLRYTEDTNEQPVKVDVESKIRGPDAGQIPQTTAEKRDIRILEPEKQASVPRLNSANQAVQGLNDGYTTSPKAKSTEEQNIGKADIVKPAIVTSQVCESDLIGTSDSMIGTNQALEGTAQNETNIASAVHPGVESDPVFAHYEKYINHLRAAYGSYKRYERTIAEQKLAVAKKVGLLSPETTFSRYFRLKGCPHAYRNFISWWNRFLTSDVYIDFVLSAAQAYENTLPFKEARPESHNSSPEVQAVVLSRFVHHAIPPELAWRILYDLFTVQVIYKRGEDKKYESSGDQNFRDMVRKRLQIAERKRWLPPGPAPWTKMHRQAREAVEQSEKTGNLIHTGPSDPIANLKNDIPSSTGSSDTLHVKNGEFDSLPTATAEKVATANDTDSVTTTHTVALREKEDYKRKRAALKASRSLQARRLKAANLRKALLKAFEEIDKQERG